MTTFKKHHPPSAMEFPRYSGIRTFMRLPNVTDLSTDVDIAIVGVPFDTGGTYRIGARFGPSGIRDQSMLLRPYNPALDVGIFEHCSCVDYGDLMSQPGYLPESHKLITEGAAKVLANDAVTPAIPRTVISSNNEYPARDDRPFMTHTPCNNDNYIIIYIIMD